MNEVERYFKEVLLPPVVDLAADLMRSTEEMQLEIERLTGLMPQCDRLVDIGSGTGWRTIALAIGLGAREVVGIDKDRRTVSQANWQLGSEFLPRIHSEVAKLAEIYERTNVRNRLSAGTRSIVDEMISRFRTQPTIQCLLGDVTTGTPIDGLSSNSFDLAHSRYCLYQIFCANPVSPSDVDRAITEMTRVVKSGGLLAAHEPITCADDQSSTFDLKAFLLRRVDLTIVHHSLLGGSVFAVAKKE